VFGGNSIKTTFCLIAWYKLDDPAPGTQSNSAVTTPA